MISRVSFLILLVVLTCASISYGQHIVKGKIIDAVTKEAVAGAAIHCTNKACGCGCISGESGAFEMQPGNCHKFIVTSIGYASQTFEKSAHYHIISLNVQTIHLQEAVLTANRGEGAKRSEAPIAITTITSQQIQDTKPAMADQVLNKISGVNMVNLGNEQHKMSIRQPMTTKSLFLYLEDGIPIRSSGLFNHNALLEMNMAATKSIEVIKGPSSSMYGSEAIGGVVNFITASPSAVPVFKWSAQANNVGYKRTDLVSSMTKNKWGFLLSAYHANRRNGFLPHSDFYKGILTAGIDYRFSEKTKLSSRITWLDYYSDMAGSMDSLLFAQKVFFTPHTFTYRKVKAVRYHITLTHRWNDDSKTSLTVLYRHNRIGQNPAYRIKDDGIKNMAHGEINKNSFQSYSFITQHRQQLQWKKAVVIAGMNAELSPSGYQAHYIRIHKDTISKRYTGFENTDSSLTDYATRLNNYAAFLHAEINFWEKLRFVVSARCDIFHYVFNNHLQASAFSGSADTVHYFYRLSPKLGFTYNFNQRTGIYANYSEGFVPPQVTELYTGVKVPDLRPSIFYNIETGGWMQIIPNKLSADISFYHLKGTNEIISVKADDGTTANQNAGSTLHQGIELGIFITPVKDITFRISGAYSKHRFVDYVEKGVSYNDNEMDNAPNLTCNMEAWYKPSYLKPLRIGAEWQYVGSYFADPLNTARYGGYHILNLRAGWRWKGFEAWLNVLNAMNHYYSYSTTKSVFGYSYQLAEPINFNLGIAFDVASLFKLK